VDVSIHLTKVNPNEYKSDLNKLVLLSVSFLRSGARKSYSLSLYLF
jgi:hypothetical protein